MTDAPNTSVSAPAVGHDTPPARPRGQGNVRYGQPPCYAALDLGTNNCRLLIARKAQGGGFRVVESFSRIVRLGEGLTATGRLSDAAMDRALAALAVCAEKVKRRGAVKLSAVATQACRSALNGPDFIARVARETGLELRVITPKEEAHLAVAGCLNLLDRTAPAALVVDVGGGSTELSWVETAGWNGQGTPPIRAWTSIPMGVVTLAERIPEPAEGGGPAWFAEMVAAVRAPLRAFSAAEPLRPQFADGRAQLIGTSGAITSLAGLHLKLERYDRSRVDGLWLSDRDCVAAAERLLSLPRAARAAEPCIGPDRADLVLAGAAILQAVQDEWPCRRLRVADRGLREGLLLAMMAEKPKRRRRRR